MNCKKRKYKPLKVVKIRSKEEDYLESVGVEHWTKGKDYFWKTQIEYNGFNPSINR